MPAPTYPTARAARHATSPISARSWGDMAAHGDGASSITFWLRRCTEHSRSLSHTVFPSRSAMTWISTCRARMTARSAKMRPSPKEAMASRCAASKARVTSSSRSTMRIPLPPPPAEALSINGKPISRAAVTATAASSTSSRPGTTGTPASIMARLAETLSPMTSMAWAEGPTKMIPAASQAATSSGRSLRKP